MLTRACAYINPQDRRYYNEIELSDLVQPGAHEDRIALTLSDRAGTAANSATAGGGAQDGNGEGGAGEESLREQFEKAERVRRVVRGVADEWEGRLADVSDHHLSLSAAQKLSSENGSLCPPSRSPFWLPMRELTTTSFFFFFSHPSSRSIRVRSAIRCAT